MRKCQKLAVSAVAGKHWAPDLDDDTRSTACVAISGTDVWTRVMAFVLCDRLFGQGRERTEVHPVARTKKKGNGLTQSAGRAESLPGREPHCNGKPWRVQDSSVHRHAPGREYFLRDAVPIHESGAGNGRTPHRIPCRTSLCRRSRQALAFGQRYSHLCHTRCRPNLQGCPQDRTRYESACGDAIPAGYCYLQCC